MDMALSITSLNYCYGSNNTASVKSSNILHHLPVLATVSLKRQQLHSGFQNGKD